MANPGSMTNVLLARYLMSPRPMAVLRGPRLLEAALQAEVISRKEGQIVVRGEVLGEEGKAFPVGRHVYRGIRTEHLERVPPLSPEYAMETTKGRAGRLPRKDQRSLLEAFGEWRLA